MMKKLPEIGDTVKVDMMGMEVHGQIGEVVDIEEDQCYVQLLSGIYPFDNDVLVVLY